MKTHIVPVNESAFLTDCQEILRDIIEKNSSGIYEIPKDLILNSLPPKVVNNFLDSFKGLTSEEIAWVLGEIKNGKLTITCDDED